MHFIPSSPGPVKLSTPSMQPTLLEEELTTAQQSPPKLSLSPPTKPEVPHLAPEQHLETAQEDHHVTT